MSDSQSLDGQDRLVALESHVAHLEQQFEQLNEVVIEQSRTLERMKAQLHRLTTTIENREFQEMKTNIQKPPHFQ